VMHIRCGDRILSGRKKRGWTGSKKPCLTKHGKYLYWLIAGAVSSADTINIGFRGWASHPRLVLALCSQSHTYVTCCPIIMP
jgi:hypothetical protein